MYEKMKVVPILSITLPPAVANIPHDYQWGKAQVHNAHIQCFSGLFAQLLGSFGTNTTLRRYIGRQHKKQQ